MNKLTIQINNLEALERLIGGDSDVEIDIRNSVVQKFAEKHLKAVANSVELNKSMESFRKTLNEHLTEQVVKHIGEFKTYYSGGTPYDLKLHPDFQRLVDANIKNAVNKMIDENVKAGIAKSTSDLDINSLIEKRIDMGIAAIVRAKVDEKMDKIKAQI